MLQQRKQAPIIYRVVNHPSGLAKPHHDTTINHVISNISKSLQRHKSAMIFIHRDFNDLDPTAVSNLFAAEQVVNFNTCGDSMLDLVFTDLIEYIDVGCKQLASIQTNDHCAISLPIVNRTKLSRY